MARTAAYKIVVTDEASHQIAALRKEIGKTGAYSPVWDRLSNEVAADARGLVPRVTGLLASTIRPAPTSYAARVEVGTPYGGVINYGWRRRNIEPSHFMNRAADAKADEAADEIADEVDRLAKKHGL